MRFIDLGDRVRVRADAVVAVYPHPYDRDNTRVETTAGTALRSSRSVAEIMADLETAHG